MPIFNIKGISSINTILWKITESEEELIRLISLTNSEKSKLSLIKSSVARKHYLATLNILREFGTICHKIDYNNFGKPLLIDSYISISHSFEYCVVILDQNKIGIDIEKFRPKIQKIQNKFISKKEFDLIGNKTLNNLTKVWTIKEAVFKAFGKHSIDFKKNIQIKNICKDFEKVVVKIFKESNVEYYDVQIINFSQYICSIAKKKINFEKN